MKQEVGWFQSKVVPGQATHSHLSVSAAPAEKAYESSWVRIAECKKQNTKQK